MSRVTPEILAKGLSYGLTPDRIEFLMQIADLPNYDLVEEGRPDSYTLIKPDPDGLYYVKASVGGKWVVKPLDSDETKSKSMLKKKLKELGYKGK
jgi:hypothetical protein